MGLLLLRLVPLVGTPNEDSSKNREGDESLALGGRRWVLKHINQPIVGGNDRKDDREDVWQGWSVWWGCFSFFGAAD